MTSVAGSGGATPRLARTDHRRVHRRVHRVGLDVPGNPIRRPDDSTIRDGRDALRRLRRDSLWRGRVGVDRRGPQPPSGGMQPLLVSSCSAAATARCHGQSSEFHRASPPCSWQLFRSGWFSSNGLRPRGERPRAVVGRRLSSWDLSDSLCWWDALRSPATAMSIRRARWF